METVIYATLIGVLGSGLIATLLVIMRMFTIRLGEISSDIGELRSDMRELVGRLDTKIEANGREISKLVTRVAVIETRLDVPAPAEPDPNPEPGPA